HFLNLSISTCRWPVDKAGHLLYLLSKALKLAGCRITCFPLQEHLCARQNGSLCYLSFSGWYLPLFKFGFWKKLESLKSFNGTTRHSLRVRPLNAIWPQPECESFKSAPEQIAFLAG